MKTGFYGRKLTAWLILSSGQGNITSNILAIMTTVVQFKSKSGFEIHVQIFFALSK